MYGDTLSLSQMHLDPHEDELEAHFQDLASGGHIAPCTVYHTKAHLQPSALALRDSEHLVDDTLSDGWQQHTYSLKRSSD